jgi:uncharacterized repeat protein (TIGR03847 family)
MLVLSSYGSASIWMEKEQLSGVGTWLAEVVERLDADRPEGDPDVEPLPFPEAADLDLRAGQLALGYAEDRDIFVFQVFDMEADPNAEKATPLLRCQLNRGQSRTLSRKIADIVAAGRQPCPMCGEPMDPRGPQLPARQRPPPCAPHAVIGWWFNCPQVLHLFKPEAEEYNPSP